ncbi:hypothetical protein [Chryseobacterium sp. M5A1_1a]
MGSLNFGKDSAEDKYASFLQDYEEYINDDLSIVKAQRVATSAWHLVDWVFENRRAIHFFTDLGLFRESLYPRCESLKIMHDIANATKHSIVSRQKGDIKDTREHNGVFSDAFSDAFDISYLEIEKNDGTKLSFRREAKKAKEFWDLYFT